MTSPAFFALNSPSQTLAIPGKSGFRCPDKTFENYFVGNAFFSLTYRFYL